MTAIVCTEYGAPDTLRLKEVERWARRSSMPFEEGE
jgi:hypothetical protein